MTVRLRSSILVPIFAVAIAACGDDKSTPASDGNGGSPSASGGSAPVAGSAGISASAGAAGTIAAAGAGGSSAGAGGSDAAGGSSAGAGGSSSAGAGGSDAAGAAGTTTAGAGGCTSACPQSKIEHLVLLVQENHTFDTHFGRYCTAAAGSNPTCNDGPACCEAGPATDPSGASPVTISDAVHAAYNPNHLGACETLEIDGGAMDKFVTASCGDAGNFGYAEQALVQPYWDRAATGALADRYFQPAIGASAANDMYFDRAGFVFADDAFEPKNAIGAVCVGGPFNSYTDTSLGDLLNTAGVPWAVYAQGYDAVKTGPGKCIGKPPSDCVAGVPGYPCAYDPGDIPFEYYASTVNQVGLMRDLTQLDADLQGDLPAISFVKLVGYKNEHPGFGIKLSDGVTAATAVMDAVLASKYGDSTLVFFTYDEGGGYFDHVAPPPASPVDQQPYGTRLPTLALGPFARKNWVSHVTMEHSSVVRFIEWNWLGGVTGQLGTRDTTVNNIGSLLDPMTTGVAVPE